MGRGGWGVGGQPGKDGVEGKQQEGPLLHPILQSPYPLAFKLLLPLIPALFRVVPGAEVDSPRI